MPYISSLLATGRGEEPPLSGREFERREFFHVAIPPTHALSRWERACKASLQRHRE
jgi:hypothetical protein